MVVECENYSDVEVVVGSYEEFVLGFKALKTEDGMVRLSQSFANHSHRASVRCVAGGGRFMASGGADDNVQLYDMKLRKEMGVLMHHDKTVTCVAFAGSTHLLSGSDDGQIALWRSGSWQCEKVLHAHTDTGVTALAVHPSGKLCLSVGKDGTLRTWNLVKGRPAYTTNLHAVGEEVAFSEDGSLYAVLKLVKGGAHVLVDVYKTEIAGVVYSIDLRTRLSCITFLQDDLIAVGTDTGLVEVHRVSSKGCVCRFETKADRVRKISACRFASGETWLITAASNGQISIFSFKKRLSEENGELSVPKLIGSVSTGCRPTCLALVVSPQGAVEPKVKGEQLEEKILLPEVRPTIPKRGVVTVELEDSDEEKKKKKKDIKGRNKNAVAKKKRKRSAGKSGKD
ncbi:p21-activated protein kinase-interacting protein 1-like [Neocloeon triangulifer]|uniref:p21-activated protein kinase-interacting protein 1-like n=1 Tax=Neocloeon triangulifer TaxID=2078957 RepID=UPI00286F5A5E|nr:p21-activated protein kinase-interacting protein 1-like [Neocloeon triangulifer]